MTIQVDIQSADVPTDFERSAIILVIDDDPDDMLAVIVCALVEDSLNASGVKPKLFHHCVPERGFRCCGHVFVPSCCVSLQVVGISVEIKYYGIYLY